jgi:DNA primase
MDVQSMHDAGMINTVASCGTEIDELQAKFLKRYCGHVTICYEGDASGIKKALIQIDLFLNLALKCR